MMVREPDVNITTLARTSCQSARDCDVPIPPAIVLSFAWKCATYANL